MIYFVGELYMLVNYAELRMAQRGDSYIMLNGFVLYESPQITRSSIIIDPNPKFDETRGVVIYPGKKNTLYIKDDKRWVDLDGDVDLQPGTVFLKDHPKNLLQLEDPLFFYYEKAPVYLIQRKGITAILN